MLTVGSLFSGIGGMDLGLERSGMICRWQVEINPFCQQVLEKYWPDVERLGDVRECGKHNLAPVDLIAGGFPCPPVSVAGRREGTEDPRWLWPEFHEIICELKPRWVLVENVLGLLSANSGRAFGGILRDLAQSGYDAEWSVLSAGSFGAPHLRERVFVVANNRGKRIQGSWHEPIPWFPAFSWCKDVGGIENLRERPNIPQPLIRGACDGIPHWMDRLRSLGNAVVPAMAQWIGQQIIKADSLA